MNDTITPALNWPRFSAIRELLRLWLQLREIEEPLTSPDGLRETLRVVARLAELVGIDAAIVDRILAVLGDEAAIEVILALLQYALGLIDASSQPDGELRLVMLETDQSVQIAPQALIDWLPFVMTLIDLLREIRGNIGAVA